MKYIPSAHLTLMLSLSIVAVLVAPARARDQVLPAGTILQCVLNEPNFSAATADVGDPVLCHLRQVVEFGEQIFPRGSYMVGHLESTKDPGHFFGKGYLKLQFDRIGLPAGDFPLNSKLISVRGYKVDREGKIDGKGHAKRDVVEWMLPPLWPWKVVTLPARGPRPKLKGETTLSLRLMDDVQIPDAPRAIGQQTSSLRRQSYRETMPDQNGPAVRRSSASRAPIPCGQSFGPEWHFFAQPRCESIFDTEPRSFEPAIRTLPSDDQGGIPSYAAHFSRTSATPSVTIPDRNPLFVMKTGPVLSVDNYSYEKGVIRYALSGGESGTISSDEIDWPQTVRANAQRGLRITLGASPHS
jgi:hypothetical protein